MVEQEGLDLIQVPAVGQGVGIEPINSALAIISTVILCRDGLDGQLVVGLYGVSCHGTMLP